MNKVCTSIARPSRQHGTSRCTFSRRRHRRVSSTPRNEADGHGATDGAPASEGIDSSDSGSDVSGTDASGDVWDGYADNGVAETELDAEIRAALATPPLDPPTHRPSQCKIRSV